MKCAALPFAGLVAFFLAGCSSGGDANNGIVTETTYVGGLATSQAVVQETPTGYRTVSGDPVVVVNGEVEPESLLPYGGGEQGIREAEDESTTYTDN